jgi:hypothetical protein
VYNQIARIALCALAFALGTVASATGLHAANLAANDLTFVIGKQWLQLTGDSADGIFRIYAAAIDRSGKTVDFPNLLFAKCTSQKQYLTLHFPENYQFRGFDQSTWLPQTEVHIRTDNGTSQFPSELNHNEFFMDLNDDEFEIMAKILRSSSIEIKIGPALESVKLLIGGSELDKAQHDIVSSHSPTGKKVDKTFSFDSVRNICLSMKSPVIDGKYWIATGTISCPDCDGSQGATSTNIVVGGKNSKKHMRSLTECLSILTGYTEIMIEKKMTADMRCINVNDLP